MKNTRPTTAEGLLEAQVKLMASEWPLRKGPIDQIRFVRENRELLGTVFTYGEDGRIELHVMPQALDGGPLLSEDGKHQGFEPKATVDLFKLPKGSDEAMIAIAAVLAAVEVKVF